ncbi:MAG TPA: hypothetical protein DHV12_08225 [Thermotogae bacterium]|nr:polyisoprenyl-teichoic acid--peptidoglycan teichoic acid transferase [Thermotogota bacterium]HCZ07093.1 hypothetical protein [Thermotogota bacterium]
MSRWWHLIGLATLLLGGLLVVLFLIPFAMFFVDLVYRPISHDPLYVLVMGVDSSPTAGGDRTDVMMLVGINQKTGNVLISSIPRDLVVGEHKINAIYKIAGIDETKRVVSSITGVPIHRYFVVNYDVFKTLSESIGPVEVYVETPMHYEDVHQNLFIHFEPGTYQLKGDELLAYIRFRYDEKGDIGRLERQRDVILKLLRKAQQELDYGRLINLGLDLLKEVKTDLDLVELVYLYSKIRKNLKISYLTFPYTVTESGDVVVDKANLPSFTEKLKNCIVEETTPKYRFLVVNNIANYPYNFDLVVKSQWASRVSCEVSTVGEELDLSPIKRNESVVFITRKGITAREGILECLKKAHPSHQFRIYEPWNLEGLDLYLHIIDVLSSNGYYIEGFDALVILGVSGLE